VSDATHGGKGDRDRTDRSLYENNWDKVFGRKNDYFHHDYEDTSTPREVLATSVYITEYGSPKAMMSQVQIDRRLKEWGMMYDCLQNMHLYEYPLEEVKELLKQIKIS
jgi:hypothetical protein